MKRWALAFIALGALTLWACGPTVRGYELTGCEESCTDEPNLFPPPIEGSICVDYVCVCPKGQGACCPKGPPGVCISEPCPAKDSCYYSEEDVPP